MVVANKPNIVKVDTHEDIALTALEQFATASEKAIASKGVFYVAISGGTTPTRLFELLGETERGKNIQWDKVQVFWVDERCVDPNDEKSNYALAAHTFLDKVDISSKNVHRVSGEATDYSSAVVEYENTIRKVFGIKEWQVPEFDLIVLGMGDDGHIGSLFPNSYANFDTADLVSAVYLMTGINRITLTHPVISAAKHLIVMIQGEKKARIVKEVFHGEPDEVKYPVHSLWPILNKVTWLIDSKAGKLL